MSDEPNPDRYLAPGTRVWLRAAPKSDADYGIVVHCWNDEEIDAYRCYVAFFGPEVPRGEPDEEPRVGRYAAKLLKVAEPSPHALMLRDTVLLLKEYQSEERGTTEYDRGYQMGFGYATDVLKHQCDAFGLRDDLGWMEPDISKWLRDIQ